MNDSEWQIERVVIVARRLNERALIAAQLQEETGCRVESAADLGEALSLLILRARLIIMDWSGQQVDPEPWSNFRAASRDVPVLILARRLDGAELAKLGIDPANVLFRPITVGDVVRCAREWLGRAAKNDRTDGREQAAH